MIYQETFLNKSLILFNLPGLPSEDQSIPRGDNVQIACKETAFLCVWATDTKYCEKKFSNHFHSPNFQGLVHRQVLNYSLCAQTLKQAQENYQTYTLKDNLS